MKRVIAVFSVVCVAAMSFVSCGDKESSSSVSEGKPTMKYPLEIGAAADGNSLTPGDPNADLDAPDPESSEDSTSSDSSESDSKENDKKEPATEIVKVTEANGQPATKVVKVTEADGQPATDDKGKEKTEVVEVTEVATKPAESSEKDDKDNKDNKENKDNKDNKDDKEQSDDKQDGNNDESYVSAEDGRYAMWLDISKDENFYFEGDMLKAQFKVKEGIPDGDYEIRISPDLSDIAGNVVRPEKVMNGVIRVNNGEIEAADASSETGLVFYGDKISCKQGDTIDFNINIKNNSGLAAFCIWFYFDSNALEFVDAGATGEFEEIARQTEIGSGSEE